MSIMPFERQAPKNTPMAATATMVPKRAVLLPMAEFRKFTASFDTPTHRSKRARANKNATMQMKNNVISSYILYMYIGSGRHGHHGILPYGIRTSTE